MPEKYTVTVEVLYARNGVEDVDSTELVFTDFTDENEAYQWRDELIDRAVSMEMNQDWLK